MYEQAAQTNILLVFILCLHFITFTKTWMVWVIDLSSIFKSPNQLSLLYHYSSHEQ